MPLVEVTSSDALFDAGIRLFQSHFADCPNARQHRKAAR
jgi:hypothetical protein